MKLVLCVLLLASAGLQLASAATCATISATVDPVARETLCYGNRADATNPCHFDYLTATCVNVAPNPTTCSEFWRDSVGCLAATSGSLASIGPNVYLKCAVNPWNNICYKPLAACATITGSDANCVARSDCKVLVSGSTCQTNPTGTCFAQSATTPAACTGAGCFYDSFAPTSTLKTCTNSLSEVITNYPTCSLWSYYPPPSSQPCDAHGCSYDPVTGLCGTQTANGGGTPSTVSLVSDFTISDIVVDPLTLVMTGVVSIPVGQYFKSNSPRYHALVLSDPAAIQATNTPLAPSVCNSLKTGQPHPAFYTGLPKVSPVYGDSIGLYNNFISAVAAGPTVGTLDFTSGPAASDLAIYQTIGYNRVSKTDTSSIIKSVSITAGSVDLAFSVSLQGGVANCGWTTAVVPNSYTQYNAKFTLYVREGDNVMTSTIIETVTVYSYGLVQTGATTANSVTYSLDPTVDTPVGCAAGEKKRLSTVREVWTNPNYAGTPATLVGLRGIQDVQMYPVLPRDVQPLSNCFGMTILSVTPPTSCPLGKCTTLVSRSSRCVPMQAFPNGDALNLCKWQPSAGRIADTGSAGGLYPGQVATTDASTLDYVQNYYHLPREWETATPTNVKYVGTDSTGATADLVAVSLSAKSYADQVDVATLVVDCGFLPYPTYNILPPTAGSAAIIVASTGAVPITQYNIRNAQLSNGGSLTLACWMRDVAQRSTYTVTLDTTSGASNFFVKPLDAQGVIPSYTYNTLTWDTNIKPVLTHSPRYMTPGGSVPAHLPVSSIVGVDGFALPAYWISAQLPSVGYVMKFGVSVSIPVGGTVSNVVSRRLLQVDMSGGNGTLSSEIFHAAFGIDHSNSTNYNVLTSALGSSKSSTAVSLAVGGAIAAATAVAMVVAYWTTTATVVVAASGVAAATAGKYKLGRI